MRQLVQQFWFLRGVAAAFSVVQFLPRIFDVSRWDVLRAFHALLVCWDDAMRWLGRLVGRIPWLPDIPPEVMNATVFASAIALPAWLVAFEPRPHPLIATMRWVMIASFTALAAVLYLMAASSPAVLLTDNWSGQLLVVGAIATFVAFWIFALMRIGGYFRGLVFILMFTATMQVLYYLNAPWVGDWIRLVTDRALTAS